MNLRFYSYFQKTQHCLRKKASLQERIGRHPCIKNSFLFFIIMKTAKYKLNDNDFLLYSVDDKTLPEDIKEIEFIEEIPDLKTLLMNQLLPIYEFNDFMVLFLSTQTETRDKKLEREHIITFRDLECEYMRIRYGISNLTKSNRDLVIEKYSEIINHI